MLRRSMRSIIAPNTCHHFVDVSCEHRLRRVYAGVRQIACIPQCRINQKNIKPLVAHRFLYEAEQLPLDKIPT